MAISIKQAQDALLYAPRGAVTFVVGPPGFGKSQGTVYAAAKRAGAHYIKQYAAVKEPVDAQGLPFIHERPNGFSTTGWAPPGDFPTVATKEEFANHTEIRVNLDDFPQATPPVQKAYIHAAYGDGVDRYLGDCRILPNVMFFGTGNRETDRAGASKPLTYVGNRITYIEVEPDVDEWASGYLGGFAVPEMDSGYPEMRRRVDEATAKPNDIVAAFVKWSKSLSNFTPDARSFKSPRSLAMLGQWLNAADVAGFSEPVVQEVASGTIGEAEAAAFLAFYKLRAHLPDVDGLLRGEDVELPPQSDILFILCASIIRAGKEQHVGAVAKLLNRLTELRDDRGMFQGAEISAFLYQECLFGAGKGLRGLRSHPQGIQWVRKFGKKYFAE